MMEQQSPAASSAATSASSVEDLSAYQALYEQFKDDNNGGLLAETGPLLTLGVELDPDEAKEAACPIEREPVADFGEQGYLLLGVLSPGECQRLVAAAEASGGLAEIAGMKLQYRSCSRAVLHEPELARRLFLRLLPHLSPVMTVGDDPVASQHVFGPACMMKGDWRPSCLNPVLRLCRYLPGQHFSPHYDGCLVHSDTNRSLKTFMLYLTDNPPGDGGATNFLDDSLTMDSLTTTTASATSNGGDGAVEQTQGRLCARPSSVQCRVQPVQGAALVFNHYRLHEGEALAAGVKYILRSDVMYERVVGPEASEAQRAALRLLQEAERLESRGRPDEAVALYRRAFRLCPELESCT